MSPSRLEWSATERQRVHEAAEAAWPEECCGILLGRRFGGLTRVLRALPVANARSAGRDRAYEIAPRDVLAAQRHGRLEGHEIVGFFHSHPDGSARPSHTDVAAAWPEASYVVVAREGAGWATASWRLRAAGDMTAEHVIEIGEESAP